MARSSLREPNWKSKPLFEKEKRVRVAKPEWPLAKGIVKCSDCGSIIEVEAHAEVVIEYPNMKFWYTGYCPAKVPVQNQPGIEVKCGALITGWAVV